MFNVPVTEQFPHKPLDIKIPVEAHSLHIGVTFKVRHLGKMITEMLGCLKFEINIGKIRVQAVA